MQKGEHKVTYLKAYQLKSLDDVERVKSDVSNGDIVIVRFTPLVRKSVDELAKAVEELYKFTNALGGDIARLGEDRIIVTPPGIKIYREGGLKY